VLRFAMKVNNSSEQMVSYNYTFPTNTWKHVAVVLSGNTGRLYLDGSQVGQNTSMTLNPGDMGATNQNWLGDSQFSADATLDGTIDDLLISCRAYSASEIAALAGSGGGGGALGCDSGNSTALTKDAEYNLTAGACYSFNKTSGTLQIGTWSGTSFGIDGQDSAAATFSASHSGNDWLAVSGVADGTGFFKVSTNVHAKWSNW
jgi:hypothetical protein